MDRKISGGILGPKGILNKRISFLQAVACAIFLCAAGSAVSSDDKPGDEVFSSATAHSGTPDIRWIELRGTVSSVNLADRSIQIEDASTRKPLEVSVTSNIRIYDLHKREWLLGDLKRGQKIIIRNEEFNKPIQ